VLSSTTILIRILSVFVFAEAMGPGCARLVQPYDGTIWNNPPLSLPPGVIHGTYHSAVTNWLHKELNAFGFWSIDS
jgi:hypothetical protein